MYDHLQGDLMKVLPGSVILRCCGVGYQVAVPMTLSDKLKDHVVGSSVKLLVHHELDVNNGDNRMFGFEDEFQRGMFRALCTVKNIGPKSAMQILVAIDARQFATMIEEKDVHAMTRIRGLGKTAAERIIVELKETLDDYVGEDRATASGSMVANATDALVALGHKRGAANKYVHQALKSFHGTNEAPTTESIVKRALGAGG